MTEEPRVEEPEEESEEESTKFLSYKDSIGTPISVAISDADIKKRVEFLKNHGCSNFVLLDADKKLIGPAE